MTKVMTANIETTVEGFYNEFGEDSIISDDSN